MKHKLSISIIILLLICSLPINAKSASSKTMIFQKYKDKTENAFTMVIPKGWQTSGGIVRVDPNAAGGAAQSIEAKFDFTISNNASGNVSMHFLPVVYFMDMSGQQAAQMFPSGSNYMGMTVLPCLSAQDYLTKLVLPYTHKGISNIKVISIKPLPEVATVFRRLFEKTMASAIAMMQLDFSYNAAFVDVSYVENGVKYREKMFAVIENRGGATGGMWSSRFTLTARAPYNDYKKWEPVFGTIANSGRLNPKWVIGEIKGQIRRGEIASLTQKQIQEIENSITSHRQKTNSEINENMFLTLTSQEKYVNPFTKEVEIGSNEWDHRWQNSNGDIIYSDNPGYNPNYDPNLKIHGFKQARVKGR